MKNCVQNFSFLAVGVTLWGQPLSAKKLDPSFVSESLLANPAHSLSNGATQGLSLSSEALHPNHSISLGNLKIQLDEKISDDTPNAVDVVERLDVPNTAAGYQNFYQSRLNKKANACVIHVFKNAWILNGSMSRDQAENIGPFVVMQQLKNGKTVGWDAVNKVTTGSVSNPTPDGWYSINTLSKYHCSNVYGAAYMGHMMQIESDGKAIHGRVPSNTNTSGSHGCVGIPVNPSKKGFQTAFPGAETKRSIDGGPIDSSLKAAVDSQKGTKMAKFFELVESLGKENCFVHVTEQHDPNFLPPGITPQMIGKQMGVRLPSTSRSVSRQPTVSTPKTAQPTTTRKPIFNFRQHRGR